MRGPNPLDYGWWLASRASGITALLLVSCSVLLGLAMATKILRGKVKPKTLVKLHEHLALAGLVAIAVHAITLLGDRWLNPGAGGLLVPFTMSYRPAFTGLGIIAAYLATALGLSFYIRRHIGAKRWRSLHRLTLAVYALAVVHTVGAGTDASTPWLQAIMIVTGAPILFLAVLRWLPGQSHAPRTPAQRVPLAQPAHEPPARISAQVTR